MRVHDWKLSRSLALVACLATTWLAPATWLSTANAELELHLTFDDMTNPGADASGKGRDAEIVNEFFVEEILWVNDPVRGGVLEFPGGNNGYAFSELPTLTGEGFTIMMWAQRTDLCCDAASGANDGLFHVTFDGDPELGSPTAGNSKVIGGWVQKSDAVVWGRMVNDLGEITNMDKIYAMDDEEWVHLAYRANGEEYELIVNGEEGKGSLVDYDGTLFENDSIFVGKQGTETWGGLLDDVRVYSSALSIEEIRDAMMGGGIGPGVIGDFNDSGSLDVGDMDLLTAEVAAGTNTASFDLDGNALVNQADRTMWVESASIANTYMGDSNLDGEFNSGDLVTVFTVGEYEDATPGNSGWGDGDWNGDGDFDSSDFVTAFSAGGYEQGPRAATAAVPEPSSLCLLLLSSLGLIRYARRR